MSSKISVRLQKNDEDGHTYFQVRLFSQKKTNLISTINISANETRIETKVAFAGGALAEEQNEKYRDLHIPDECARVAVECYKDVLKKIEYGKQPTSTTK